MRRVVVTGGAGYVGAVLVPKLLATGWAVRVLDLCIFGDQVLPLGHPHLELVRGDIRDAALVDRVSRDAEAFIHLACVSNDPSFELNPALSRTINFECFEPMVLAAKRAGVGRFIYASTSSVYGVSDAPEVTETHPLVPITDYNKYKGLCEPLLLQHASDDFICTVIRPATICGYSPRLRLDLTVNLLTAHAIENRKITVFGGEQKRPNLHIQDMTDLYVDLLSRPAAQIASRTFNACCENATVMDIARRVKAVVEREVPGPEIPLVVTSSDDPRSYHISAKRIAAELGFVPKRSIEDATRELCDAFRDGKIPNAMKDTRYYNIRTLQASPMGAQVGA